MLHKTREGQLTLENFAIGLAFIQRRSRSFQTERLQGSTTKKNVFVLGSHAHRGVAPRPQLQVRGHTFPSPPRLFPGLEHLPHGCVRCIRSCAYVGVCIRGTDNYGGGERRRLLTGEEARTTRSLASCASCALPVSGCVHSFTPILGKSTRDATFNRTARLRSRSGSYDATKNGRFPSQDKGARTHHNDNR